MKKFSSKIAVGGLAVLAVMALLIAQTGLASAHARLKTASILPDSTITTAPATLTLTFGEETSSTNTKLAVLGSDGKNVDKGDLKVDGATITIGLNPLNDGKYTVKFTTFTEDDNGLLNGEYSFTVAKSGTATTGDATKAKQEEVEAAPTGAPNTGDGATATDTSAFTLYGLATAGGLLVMAAVVLGMRARRQRR